MVSCLSRGSAGTPRPTITAADAEVGLEVCFDVGPFEEDASAALDVRDDAAALPVLDGAHGSAEPDRKGFFSDEPFGFGPYCVVVVVLSVHRFWFSFFSFSFAAACRSGVGAGASVTLA